jgi:hypothetical protein
MAAAGVCGIRVNFVSPQSWGTTTPEMLVALAKKVNDLNWHVQVLMLGEQIAQMESVLQRAPNSGRVGSSRSHTSARRARSRWLCSRPSPARQRSDVDEIV